MAQTCRDRRIVKPSWRNFKKAPQAGNVVAGNDSRRPGRDEQASVLSECFFQRLPLKKLFRKFLLEFGGANSWFSTNDVQFFDCRLLDFFQPCSRFSDPSDGGNTPCAGMGRTLRHRATSRNPDGNDTSGSPDITIKASRKSAITRRTSRRSASLGNPGPSAIACLASTSTSS